MSLANIIAPIVDMDPVIKVMSTVLVTAMGYGFTNFCVGNLFEDWRERGVGALGRPKRDGSLLGGVFDAAAVNGSRLFTYGVKLGIAGTFAWWTTGYYMDLNKIPNALGDTFITAPGHAIGATYDFLTKPRHAL